MPSKVKVMCCTPAPRIANSLRKSSPAATAGSDLDGAHRIVGQHAAQLLQLAAAECLLGGDRRLARA